VRPLKLEDIPVEDEVGGPLWVDVVAVKAEAVRRAHLLRVDAVREACMAVHPASREFAHTNSGSDVETGNDSQQLETEADDDEYEPLTWGVGGESPPKPTKWYQFA
jgi:hypothetical protein